MKFYIVIPAHNEAENIGLTLQSLVEQTVLPKQVVVVNDNSTDDTKNIVASFQSKHKWISIVNATSSNKHLSGAKIINAFYKGFETLDDDYDVVCKFDADLIFPDNYLERLTLNFNKNPKLGMNAGYCYIKKNNAWILEGITGKNHIRGALKAYRKQCFLDIGKLKKAMGWDTVDELLAKYYHWDYTTDETLKVKHLKPTGLNYNTGAKYLFGQSMFSMRYGFVLSFIIGLQMSYKRKSFTFFTNFVSGYLKASKEKTEHLVTKSQGRFIRKLKWKALINKLGF